MPKPAEGAQRYMPGLDGLRAIAVLAVIAYHLELDWAQGGLLGVGVFFTLSGYLITDLLLGQREVSGRLRLGNFWIRRARRLLPAVFLMLAVVVAWVTLVDPSRMADLRGDVAAAALYVSNWWNIFQNTSYFAQFGPPPPLRHLWSLAIEEQFYLIWPWLLWLGLRYVRGRYRLAGLTLAAAAISATVMWLLYQPGSDPTRVYEGTDTRAFGLLIGAALAMVWPSRHLRTDLTFGRRQLLEGVGAVGLVVIALLIWGTNQYSVFLYHGGIVVLSVATALTVAALAHPASRLGPALGWGPLRWVGVRSYGIYLWHFPIIVLTSPNAMQKGVSLPLGALQVGATIAVAALSWRFVEEPIRRGALGRFWEQARSGWWHGESAPRRAVQRRIYRRRRRQQIAAGVVSVVALSALAVDGVGLAGVVPAAPGGEAAGGTGNGSEGGGLPPPGKAPPATKPSTNHEPTAPPATSETPATSSPKEATSATRTSCDAVAYIGDSTSRGLNSPDYLPDPDRRLDAQFERVGATSHHFKIQGARSVVETLSADQANAQEVARNLKDQGFDGCWVIALGNNDTANVYMGSGVGRMERIERMMSAIGDQPVMWMTTKTLLDREPYSEANMKVWNRTVVEACERYPNMAVFDWASMVKDRWYGPDGIHYTPEGYANRARLTAEALAHAFPASGGERGSSCVVH